MFFPKKSLLGKFTPCFVTLGWHTHQWDPLCPSNRGAEAMAFSVPSGVGVPHSGSLVVAGGDKNRGVTLHPRARGQLRQVSSGCVGRGGRSRRAAGRAGLCHSQTLRARLSPWDRQLQSRAGNRERASTRVVAARLWQLGCRAECWVECRVGTVLLAGCGP